MTAPPTLGPYRLDRELGAGGMVRVYAAIVEGRAPGLDAGTRVALKIVHPHLLETPGFFLRFVREAEIGRSVVHENVVRTHMADEIVVGVAHDRTPRHGVHRRPRGAPRPRGGRGARRRGAPRRGDRDPDESGP